MNTDIDQNIENIRRIAQITHQTLFYLAELIQHDIESEGWISCAKIDHEAEHYLSEHGATACLKGYNPPFTNQIYQNAMCISINDEVVHGVPHQDKIITTSDLVKLDIAAEMNGWYADTAISVLAGAERYQSQESLDLVRDTRRILDGVITRIEPGWTTRDIATYIQKTSKELGLTPCEALSGHGIGRKIHMEPNVPNSIVKIPPIRASFPAPVWRGDKLESGMILCIEPMLTTGSGKVFVGEDGWVVRTADSALAAHFEPYGINNRFWCGSSNNRPIKEVICLQLILNHGSLRSLPKVS